MPTDIFETTPSRGQIVRLVKFTEYDDLVARVYSSRGSSPIAFRMNGEDVSDEEIGRAFREACTYLLKTETF